MPSANAVFEAHLKFHSEEAGSVLHIDASYGLHWISFFGEHYFKVLAALSKFWYEFCDFEVSCFMLGDSLLVMAQLLLSQEICLANCQLVRDNHHPVVVSSYMG
jgi:hypothetical protein